MKDGAMDMDYDVKRQVEATQGALLVLVDRLAMRGVISVDDGIDILQLLSRGSGETAERVSRSLELLSRLRRLRAGDSEAAPGAPSMGPIMK
jgi:hypothetical protein